MEPVIEFLALLGILVFGAFIRYIPHIKYYFPSTPDTFFFLNKFRDSDYKSNEIYYPGFFIDLIRFFLRGKESIPEMTLNRLAPLVDIITSAIIYSFLRNLFGAETALLSILLFLVTPIVAKQGVCLSVRSFSLLLFCTSLLLLTMPFPWNWLALIPIALTLLSHRLSTQTLFFTCFALSLFDFQIGLISIAGLFLAVILSKGEYTSILRNHASAIWKYMKGEHYSNKRLKGLATIPSFLGFVAYLSLFILQSVGSLPFNLLGFEISGIVSLNPYAEALMLIWGIVCLLLLIFWLAGESYKHLYLATLPFAIASALLRLIDPLFEIALIFLVVGSITISLYFLLRFDHIDKEFVDVVSVLKNLDSRINFLAPSGYDRAAEYYSGQKGAPVYFMYTSKDELFSRAEKDNITHIIVQAAYRDWFESWKEIASTNEWYVLERTSV